jgi:ATP-dependent DNA ligase
LAPIAQERFTGPEWIFERKFDGIRLLAFHQGNECTPLVSQSSPAELPSGGAGAAATAGARDHPRRRNTWGRDGAIYHVFDLLWLAGRDVSLVSLDERHTLLQTLP